MKKKIISIIKLGRVNNIIPIIIFLFPILFVHILENEIFNIIKKFYIFLIFIIELIIVRTFGCIINDIVDCKIDAKIPRTRMRALPNKEISLISGIAIYVILIIISIIILFTMLTNISYKFILMSFILLFMINLYPFVKRFFIIPQFFLGITCNFSVILYSGLSE